MEIKSFFYGVISAFILILILTNLGIAHLGSLNGKTIASTTNTLESNIPENCKPPAGQDINSWKEHLSHHEETKACLKYFK